MGLKPHGRRKLSNLERAAVDLVFWVYTGSDKEMEQMFDDLRLRRTTCVCCPSFFL